MTQTRGQQILLTVGFLATIGVVPAVQAVIEIGRGEPVQALDLFRHLPTVRNLRLFEEDLESQSWFAGALRPPVQYARFELFGDAGHKALVGRNDWWFFRRGVQYLTEPVPDRTPDNKGHQAAMSAILDFRDQLAAMGIELLVVPVPGKASVYPDQLTTRADGPMLHTPTDSLLQELNQADVQTVNLLQVFRTARNQPDHETLYLPRDTHWSPVGLRLAAKVVARKIREMTDFGPVHPQAYETRSAVVHRLGDIVRMLQAPMVNRLYPADTIRCEQVISSTTGELYEDRDDSPILVLGDSFLRIYEQDEPKSAGFIAHLARELSIPLSSIVNDGGASTLVRQELTRKPEMLRSKKLVVWEFIERDIRFGLEGWQHIQLAKPTGIPLP